MTPQQAAQTLLNRRMVRRSLRAWCETALEPMNQKPARHHELLISKLEDVAAGKIQRLMVFMPPGSAKTTYANVLFSVWWFTQFPQTSIIAASHTYEFAEGLGRKSRNFVAENAAALGYGIRSDSGAAGRWHTTTGGEYIAVGVGQAISGRRADLVIMDDVVSGIEAADSASQREKLINWYRSDLTTRMKPGAKIVLILTRWRVDDIAGTLLEEMKNGGEQWDLVSLPALAGTDDPLGREPGEPLWPDWQSHEELRRIRKVQGERNWHSLYMQNPQPDEGSIIRADWWVKHARVVTNSGKLLPLQTPEYMLMSLDTAYTDKTYNDASACTVWHVYEDRATYRMKILLRYAWKKRLEFHELLEEIVDTIDHFKEPRIPLQVIIEAKATGISLYQELRRRLPDVSFTNYNPGRDNKVARAYAITSLLEAGLVEAVAIRQANGDVEFTSYTQEVISECAQFPLGASDDYVDSVSMALRRIRDSGFELFPEDEVESPVKAPAPLF